MAGEGQGDAYRTAIKEANLSEQLRYVFSLGWDAAINWLKSHTAPVRNDTIISDSDTAEMVIDTVAGKNFYDLPTVVERPSQSKQENIPAPKAEEPHRSAANII